MNCDHQGLYVTNTSKKILECYGFLGQEMLTKLLELLAIYNKCPVRILAINVNTNKVILTPPILTDTMRFCCKLLPKTAWRIECRETQEKTTNEVYFTDKIE
jgi:hypothetical protein